MMNSLAALGMSPAVVFLMLLFFTTPCFALNYNVMSFGAKPDGKTDSTKAFLAAWTKACASVYPATIHVPKGRFLLGKAVFDGGDCKNRGMALIMGGTLVANSGAAVGMDYWLLFQNVEGLKISGGVIDGRGAGIWACKKGGKNCPDGRTSMGILSSSNVVVSGLTSLNSQLFNIVILSCKNVHLRGVKVTAPGDSPNTDGIHVQDSTIVSILASKISTGDDCVSIGPGTRGLLIENMACGPGHGISIGSLGKDLNEDGVQNVTVRTVTFTGTQNGVRIKSWARPSKGFVRDVLFQNCIMNKVQNPIIINQNYCPHNEGCPNQVSGIKISDITYQNIRGTSATEVAVKLDCSPAKPCTGIRMTNVKLTYKDQPAEASCIHAGGNAAGLLQPQTCL